MTRIARGVFSGRLNMLGPASINRKVVGYDSIEIGDRILRHISTSQSLSAHLSLGNDYAMAIHNNTLCALKDVGSNQIHQQWPRALHMIPNIMILLGIPFILGGLGIIGDSSDLGGTSGNVVMVIMGLVCSGFAALMITVHCRQIKQLKQQFLSL